MSKINNNDTFAMSVGIFSFVFITILTKFEIFFKGILLLIMFCVVLVELIAMVKNLILTYS